jgi:hypothetical protein
MEDRKYSLLNLQSFPLSNTSSTSSGSDKIPDGCVGRQSTYALVITLTITKGNSYLKLILHHLRLFVNRES